jgi:peptidoglycan/xylan/chitin deacetylase (PgdA/CDA1 family)
MLHRLHSFPQRYLYHGNCYSENGLVALIEHCLSSGVDIVNIDEALRRLREDDERYFVVLTFDDGYRDNYLGVLPIMNKYGLPFTVFVCSSIIERTFDNWWGGLIDLFRLNDSVDVEAMGMRFVLHNIQERQAALRKATRWVEEEITSRSAKLVPTFKRYGVAPADLLDQDAMTEEDLRRTSESPLVTIGGHGLTHRPLASLPESEAQREIAANREHLERTTGKEVAHFSYPFGDASACNWREAELVQSAGYRSAFTTRVGNLFPQHSATPFMLPRNAVHPLREQIYHTEAQFAGVHRFVQSCGGPPIHPDTVRPFRAAQ